MKLSLREALEKALDREYFLTAEQERKTDARAAFFAHALEEGKAQAIYNLRHKIIIG